MVNEITEEEHAEVESLVAELHEVCEGRHKGTVMCALMELLANGICINAYGEPDRDDLIEKQLAAMSVHVREWVALLLRQRRQQDNVH